MNKADLDWACREHEEDKIWGDEWSATTVVKFLRHNIPKRHPCSKLIGREYIVETKDEVLRCIACDYCEIEDTTLRLKGVHAHCMTPKHISHVHEREEEGAAEGGTTDKREQMLELYKKCPGLIGVEHIIVNPTPPGLYKCLACDKVVDDIDKHAMTVNHPKMCGKMEMEMMANEEGSLLKQVYECVDAYRPPGLSLDAWRRSKSCHQLMFAAVGWELTKFDGKPVKV